jgi:hypothetical protein
VIVVVVVVIVLALVVVAVEKEVGGGYLAKLYQLHSLCVISWKGSEKM